MDPSHNTLTSIPEWLARKTRDTYCGCGSASFFIRSLITRRRHRPFFCAFSLFFIQFMHVWFFFGEIGHMWEGLQHPNRRAWPSSGFFRVGIRRSFVLAVDIRIGYSRLVFDFLLTCAACQNSAFWRRPTSLFFVPCTDVTWSLGSICRYNMCQ